MNLKKAQKRDIKIHKNKHGMRIDGVSVKLIVQIQKNKTKHQTKKK